MFRNVLLLVLGGAAYCQSSNQTTHQLAGCYEVSSLAWEPPNEAIKVIPQRLELQLQNDPKWKTFAIRSLVPGEGDDFKPETFWSWKPKGANKIGISFGTGLGGFRGVLRKSKDGDLIGKLKEWCDSRCGYKKRIGMIQLRKIRCE
ncbi:MAG TPA: hypothetical protein VMG82_16915 [Candidatus Sulfotelmatobacter sp.]|nr:hypothetical protein [Candidatus Sulfotelmatobacter sp.]